MANRDISVQNQLQENSPFHEERVNFKTNLLKNPNYFGTFPGLGNVIKKIEYNTTYEELACLGLNPGGLFAAGTLEAVLNINRGNGYDSGPCGNGSTEWVRFYVEDGGSWTDLGVSGVTVYNVAGNSFPVSYAVSIEFDHVRRFCTVENVLNVRAILSWELEPPANTPGFIPVWGNAVNARVQLAPAFFEEVPLSSLLASELVKIDPIVAASVDVTQALPTKALVPLSFGALRELYADSNVPVHRFGFAAATKLAAKPIDESLFVANANKGLKNISAQLTLGSELASILNALEEIEGNTTYEQLTCAGYNPQTRTLEAVVEIKLNSGYSGSLCTAGSKEYVSFFAYFGGVWNALGTAQVVVHDLKAVAAGGPVSYAVYRLSNLTSEVCESLEAVPLRAILSWQTMPTGPDFVPVWGNVLNTFVQPQIAAGENQQEKTTILRIGDVGVEGIKASTNPDINLHNNYLANPTGAVGDCNNADDSPFAGSILIEASFFPESGAAFDTVTGVVLPGAHPIIYQAFITPPVSVGPQFQLTNQFGIGVFPVNAPIGSPEVTIQQKAIAPYGPVAGTGLAGLFYTYYESSDGQLVNPRAAAEFEAGGLQEGNYTVEIVGYAWDGALYKQITAASQTFYVYNGYEAGGNAPETSINLTSAADCGNIVVGDTITGEYSVSDEFFGSVTIAMTPVSIDDVGLVMPTVYLSNANYGPDTVVYDGTNTEGTSGMFTIYTNPALDPAYAGQPLPPALPPCGYTIQLTAVDRALVDTTCNHHESQEAVGFCLVAAEVQ